MSNQASEDKLQTAVNRCFIPHDDHSWPCVGCKSTRDNIVNLIRTEKLKLLDEVRERVIGENERGTITNPDIPSYGEQYESTLADKDELRAELAKLETEL